MRSRMEVPSYKRFDIKSSGVRAFKKYPLDTLFEGDIEGDINLSWAKYRPSNQKEQRHIFREKKRDYISSRLYVNRGEFNRRYLSGICRSI